MYDNLHSILIQNDGDSSKIKECFLKAGVKRIYHKPKRAKAVSYDLITDVEAEDELFNLSINWDYSKIVEQLSTIDNIFEKAYYQLVKHFLTCYLAAVKLLTFQRGKETLTNRIVPGVVWA